VGDTFDEGHSGLEMLLEVCGLTKEDGVTSTKDATNLDPKAGQLIIRKVNRCGKCKALGHKITTCPLLGLGPKDKAGRAVVDEKADQVYRVYEAQEDESVVNIAVKLQVNAKRLVSLNECRYLGLSTLSCLYAGTLLLLPGTSMEDSRPKAHASRIGRGGWGQVRGGDRVGGREEVSDEREEEGTAATMTLPDVAKGKVWEPYAEFAGLLTLHDGKERCFQCMRCNYCTSTRACNHAQTYTITHAHTPTSGGSNACTATTSTRACTTAKCTTSESMSTRARPSKTSASTCMPSPISRTNRAKRAKTLRGSA